MYPQPAPPTKGIRSFFIRAKSPESTLPPVPRKDRPTSAVWQGPPRTIRTSDGKRTRPPSPGQTKRNIRFARLPPMQKGDDGKWQPPSLSRGSISTSALAAYADGTMGLSPEPKPSSGQATPRPRDSHATPQARSPQATPRGDPIPRGTERHRRAQSNPPLPTAIHPHARTQTDVVPLSEAHYNIRLCTSFIVKCLTPVVRGAGFLGGHVEMRKIAEQRLVLLERMERNWGAEWSAMAGEHAEDRIRAARVGERQKERERRTMVDALRDGVLLCFLFNHLVPNQPPHIPRVNISEDGLFKSTNVTRFIAACQNNGLQTFMVGDLQEGTESGLGTVARAVLGIARQHHPVRATPAPRPARVAGDVSVQPSPMASRVASPNPTSPRRPALGSTQSSPASPRVIPKRPVSTDITDGLASRLQSGMDITPPSSGFVIHNTPATPAKVKRQSAPPSPSPISPVGSRSATPTKSLFPGGRQIRPRSSRGVSDPATSRHLRERTPSLVSGAYTRTSTAFSMDDTVDETIEEDRMPKRLWHRRDSEQTLQNARLRLGSLLSSDDLPLDEARGQAIGQSLRALEGRGSPAPRRHNAEGSGDRLSEADEGSSESGGSGFSRRRRPSMIKRASTNGKIYVPKRSASPTRNFSPSASTLNLPVENKTLVFEEPGQPPIKYQLGNCVGKGQFGSVYRSLHLGTGQMAAIKRIRLEGMIETEVRDVMKEVDLLKRLTHPSIVKYEGMSRDEDYLNIVLEFVENGSLGQTIKAFGVFNEQLASSYVAKILEGLDYLHSQGVVHCDLKAANILSTKNGNIKLSDFGVSLNMKAVENIKQDVQTHGKRAPNIGEVAGTPHWMAPEVISLNGASPASDIWSLGCTIIEFLTGKPPYADITNSMSVLFRIVEDDEVPLPPVTTELGNFLRLCFIKNPAARPTAAHLSQHAWLQSQDVLRPQDSVPFLRRVSMARASALFEPEGLPRVASAVALETIAYTPPLEHTFVRTSFGSAIPCRICHTSVKKVGVLCQSCGLIAHPSCVYRSSTHCDTRPSPLAPSDQKLGVKVAGLEDEQRRSAFREMSGSKFRVVKRESRSDCLLM